MTVSVAARRTTRSASGVGHLLRGWRQHRRLSQLDLANLAEVSARHLSFVETGRSKPSRELILHLAHHLDVPLRDQNQLLLAGGFAPAHSEVPLDAGPMEPVRQALDQILSGHEPYPSMIVNQRWELVLTNDAGLSILGSRISPELLEPPANVLRASLHPDGLAPHITNFGEYSAHMLSRLHRQAMLAQDTLLSELYEELRGYPGVAEGPSSTQVEDETSRLFVPVRLATDEGELAFFSTIATFGTALDVTLAELAIESFFPANAETAALLHGRDPGWSTPTAA